MKNRPSVSIIIPTFNEEKHIALCLQSLQEQTYKPIEIIVVDDGSSDSTRALVKAFPKVTLLKQDHQGPGTARNKGARKAKGEIVVFVDADMTFDPYFITKLTEPIRNGKTIGTFSKDEYVANFESKWARAWSRLRGFTEGRMHPKNYPNQQPVFRAIIRKEFLKVGGFDTNRGYDDDWSLSEKLGVLATSAKGATFYHYNPESLGEIYAQARWMASRKYKFGVIGRLLNALKTFPVLSLLKSGYTTVKHKDVSMFPASLVYDWALFTGAITGKRIK